MPAGLTFNTSTGQFTGTPTTGGSYPVTVTVNDSSSQTATTSAFIWNMLDIVSPPATFSSTLGSTITPIDAGAVGGSGNFAWSISSGALPPGTVTLNGTTGVISGKPSTSTNQVYTFTLQVKDNVTTLVNTQSITWTVTSALIVVTPNANQFSVVGTAITPVTATSSGGNGAAATYSVTGTLPPGLSASGGTVSGTPTSAGAGNTYTVTFKATRNGTTVQQVVSWTIYAAATAITNPTTTQTTKQNVAITPFAATATGGSGYVSWSVSGTQPLPTGISLSSSGTFSGTPTGAKQSYTVTITATDATGVSSASKTFTWTVN